MFDICVAHAIVTRNYTAPIDADITWDVITTFYESLEGRTLKYNELVFTKGSFHIEWCDRWDVVNMTKNEYIFRIMPIDCIPDDIFSQRHTAYQDRLSKSDRKPYKFRMVSAKSNIKRNSFLDKYVQQQSEKGATFRADSRLCNPRGVRDVSNILSIVRKKSTK